jgi:hypothetical protein
MLSFLISLADILVYSLLLVQYSNLRVSQPLLFNLGFFYSFLKLITPTVRGPSLNKVAVKTFSLLTPLRLPPPRTCWWLIAAAEMPERVCRFALLARDMIIVRHARD